MTQLAGKELRDHQERLRRLARREWAQMSVVRQLAWEMVERMDPDEQLNEYERKQVERLLFNQIWYEWGMGTFKKLVLASGRTWPVESDD